MKNYFIFPKKLLIFLGYIAGVFRGTRQLVLEEGRVIAKILRREYCKLFTDREQVLGRHLEFSNLIRFFTRFENFGFLSAHFANFFIPYRFQLFKVLKRANL
jgi:hypothetical protein